MALIDRKSVVQGGGAADGHSSVPCVQSLAVKSRVLPTAVKLPGALVDAGLPGWMSWTRAVPPSVPSDFHSSMPCVPSLAAKKSLPLTFVRSALPYLLTKLPALPLLMSL